MTGVVTLPQSLAEVGRIRLGDERRDPRRPGAPLDRLRITVADTDRPILEDVVGAYGGVIQPWKDGDGSPAWQAIIAADSIDVAIPPNDSALSIWFEQWAGGFCRVRCNGLRCQRPVGKGEAAHWEEGPCICDPESPECGLTTRLSVVLLGVPAYGLFRLDTGSAHAARHFPAVVEMAQRLARDGNPVPATLSIQAKTTKNLGRATPKQNFKIPVLRLAVGLSKDMLLTAGTPGPLQIEAPKSEVPPPSPIPPDDEPIEAEATEVAGDSTDTDLGQSAEQSEGVASRQQAAHQGAGRVREAQASSVPEGGPADESAPTPATSSGPAWRSVRYAEARADKPQHFQALSAFQKAIRGLGSLPQAADDMTLGEIAEAMGA